ncbi:hypothetical protein DXG01_007903 [Tephrocybe rancida]|nr:hypothetical protein DXG01_007903 [Tephrocybe rancida]
MPNRGLPYHVLAPALLSVARAAPHRLLTKISRPLSSARISIPVISNATPPPTSDPSPPAFLRERKLNDLKDSLLRISSPSHVWADYTDLLNVMGFDNLPLEIHQQVLRQCTPPSTELRAITAKRLAAGNPPSTPHLHEGRFQTIIRNIRAGHSSPELDDYHFILEQFAAVGHHVGAMHVYKELAAAGLMPKPKTFGLCLQAIAHRMQLPILERQRKYMLTETHKMMSDLVREMRRLRIAFTSANLDLTIRILKETLDLETFEEMMKWGYGIDLSNPDRPPVDFFGPQNLKSDLGMDVPADISPNPQPFSTAALNTTIEILGRIGNVSKLVQAFEVLTQPLPRASEHMFSSFDDDDDFGVANTPKTTPYAPPHATPNTTSYIMLIRHLCTIGHATLARHYANEAMFYEHYKDRMTKTQIQKRQDAVSAPRISVNRGTFLPILGLSNRTKNLTLTRWLLRKLPGVMKRKRYNLNYYYSYREKQVSKASAKQSLKRKKPQISSAETSVVDTINSSPAESPIDEPPTTEVSTTPASADQPISLLERSRRNKPQEQPLFEVDIDSLPPPPTAPFREPVRTLDIDLHIRILEHDIAELEEFSQRVNYLLGRSVQRVKEGLGRRVWAGKDIYVAHENRRRQVSREDWIKDVRFLPRKVDASYRPPAMIPDTSPAGTRSTFFQSNNTAQSEVPQSVLTHLKER